MSNAVLLVEDDAALSGALTETLRLAEIPCELVATMDDALLAIERNDHRLVVTDVNLAGADGFQLLRALQARPCPPKVVMMTAYGTVERAVSAMKEGAVDYLAKPFRPRELVACIRKHTAPAEARGDDLIAEDSATRALLAMADRAADSDATVLLLGESGVGKEVISRYLHEQSPRRTGRFVALNCAAIPETMLEAVMFGHEKGSFTGATRSQSGKFEQANGGTLLLDEISEMALPLQAKLLRVIQEREVERVGGNAPIPLNVRLIATTNRDLTAMVAAGDFREDLYYRLNVFPLTIPALRDRPNDVVPLARHLLSRYGGQQQREVSLSEEAELILRGHHWPGNVRELENLIQRLLILCRSSVIPAAALDGLLAVNAVAADPSLRAGLAQTEQQAIVDALAQCAGNRKETAELLGVSERTLRYKLARLREQGILSS